MKARNSIRQQLRRNTVALISLVVAIVSLSYNTWRNEVTEHNRNQRTGAFEVLLKLGELQELVFYLHFDREVELANPRAGWGTVLTIRDIAQVLEDPLPRQSESLVTTWGEHWAGLGEDDASFDAIKSELEATRRATQALIADLE